MVVLYARVCPRHLPFMLLEAVLGRVRKKQARTLDLIIEEPVSPTLARRVQRFAGHVTSTTPIPELRFTLGGVEQVVHRYDVETSLTADGGRYTTYWTFHQEIGALSPDAAQALILEGFAGAACVVRKIYQTGRLEDRVGPLLVIPHIPKTAGTSLRVSLERQPTVRLLNLYYDRAFMPLSDCDRLSPEALDDIDVLFGHFPYNMHRISHRTYEYMTVLRHPADILKSYYLFNKYLVQNDAYRQYSSIADALQACTDKTFDNVITRYMAGKVTHDPVTDDDFALALSNMERDFSYVGTIDEMQASLDVIGTRLGVQLEPHNVNVTPPNAEADAIDRAWLLKRFASSVEYDLRLYERALELYAAGPRPVAATTSLTMQWAA